MNVKRSSGTGLEGCLVSCFLPSREISQSPSSSTLVSIGGDYTLRKSSKFVVINESGEALALAFMMKDGAGVRGVAGTARLRLGMGTRSHR